ncbi:VOC family protein [Aurantiacibacter spongiae]|uniref:VOC family protein n=1 Tax=Aurantiacibacter spongiae TaxID=2488860 RepID=A0A3N5CVY3_9SPHN|nr:VOC family protein [Aurantiacibacter spongiae]RPF70809.1 VOC family protein [Aurantiacibacter spongiae]
MTDPTGPRGRIEHVNLTVSDLDRSIALFERLLGWRLRLRDAHGVRGEFAHVGTHDDYLALWSDGADHSGQRKGRPMNHVGLQVDDLDAAERVVRDAGLRPFGQGRYAPGPRTFYFLDWDGIEFEVVSYA